MSILSVYDQSRPEQPNKVLTYLEDIVSTLATVGVRVERWAASAPLQADAGQDDVMAAYRADLDRLIAQGGYGKAELFAVDRDTPEQDALRARLLQERRYAEDKAFFFVAGSGLFNLHIGDAVYALLCEKNDLLVVPAGTAHWFDMGENPYFMALRMFNTAEDGTPTGDDIASRFPGFEN